MSHIILKINVKSIRKDWLFAGQKGTYLDAVVYQNDNEDEYGNSHVIRQNPPKEAREAGEKGVIIGNGRWMSKPKQQPQQRPAQGQRKPSEHGQKWDDVVDDHQDDTSIPF